MIFIQLSRLDCHDSFFSYPSPSCLADFLFTFLVDEMTSDVGIISDESDSRRCNVCFARVFTFYKSMNIFSFFLQDSVPTCLRDFELDIHKLDLFNVLPKPPALIGAMKNRETVFVEVAIDANVFHGLTLPHRRLRATYLINIFSYCDTVSTQGTLAAIETQSQQGGIKKRGDCSPPS